ncbi:MAG: peptidoglycan DD-metalloendopeptidase family protein [Rhodospirillaceae bacterium]|jgi:murein DD-endopeptidase MepM/ murein hydrolase activator NlpD|nr:peptidoglycan DD-metalloendopeptidase family protein [Rhodospirillaceae bacterium]
MPAANLGAPLRWTKLILTPAVLRAATLGFAVVLGANAMSGLPAPASPATRAHGPHALDPQLASLGVIALPGAVLPRRPPEIGPAPDNNIVGPLSFGPVPKIGLQSEQGFGEASVLPATHRLTLEIKPGDTLMNLLVEKGVPRNDAHEAITVLSDVFDPRHIRPGQELVLTFGPGGDGANLFQAASFAVSYDSTVEIRREADGFAADTVTKQLDARPTRAEGRIESSLMQAGIDVGVPAAVMIEMIRAYSFDVDFQRDIQEGDSFEVMYERLFDERSAYVHYGTVRYAALTLSGKTYRLYLFEGEDGKLDYFNEKGASVRKALMRTPVDGARISSTFGKRRHPILGYTKMHKGTDFAAPSGTPIMAAGDGVVEKAGRSGGYGNYVRIRHNGTYKTAYAHLSKFARGVRAGSRVRQGDIIGYVGSTGRSTGPHLHYEIHMDGKQINPMNVRMPSGRTLAGGELEQFQAMREAADRTFAALTPYSNPYSKIAGN